MFVDHERIAQFGLDGKAVASIARRISKAALEAKRMGIGVFGGSGTGSMRLIGRGISGTVAELDGSFDGGDGGDDY